MIPRPREMTKSDVHSFRESLLAQYAKTMKPLVPSRV